MRRVVLLLVVLALAAGGYALWRTSGDPAPADAGSTSRAAPPASAEAQRLSGRDEPPRASPGGQGGDATVRGRVLRSGVPVAAKVEVRTTRALDFDDEISVARTFSFEWLQRDLESRTLASADGRFELVGLANGTHVLVAMDGDDRAATVVDTRDQETRSGLTLDLTPGVLELRGRVWESPGHPWEGRLVVSPAGKGLVAAGDPDEPPLRTDVEGRFVATGLRPGRHVVVAVEPGRARVIAAVVVPHDGEWTLVLAEPTDEVAGRVVKDEDGSPVEGATVLATPWGAPGRLDVWKTSTAQDGSFRLPGGGTRSGYVRAFAPGFAPASEEIAKVPLTVRLQRFGRVLGHVHEEATGRALPGLVLRANERETTTDAEGAYSFDRVPPESLELCVVSSEWILEGPEGPQLDAIYVPPDPGGDLVVDLLVSRGGSIRGVVLDAAGRPAAGATVTCEATPDAESLRDWTVAAKAVADGEGRFSLAPLVPGQDYDLGVQSIDAMGSRAGPFRARLGGSSDVELRLHPPRHVVVQVVERGTRAPVAGATVVWRVEDGNDRSLWTSRGEDVTTDLSGTARIGPCPPGRLRVTASAAEFYEADGGPDVVEASGTTLEVEVERGLAIEGLVAGAEALSLVIVEAYGPQDADADADSDAGFSAAETQVREDGAFRLTGLRSGRYLLTLGRIRGVRVPAAAGDRGVVLRVPAREPPSAVVRDVPDPRHELTVRVLGADGTAVTSAELELRKKESTESGRAWKGAATFRGTAEELAGATIEVWNAREASGRALGWAHTHVGPLVGTETEIDVRMPAGRSIEGRVVDAKGIGVPACRVGAHVPIADEPVGPTRGTTRTRTDGSFSITGLAERRYDLVVEGPSECLVVVLPASAGDRDVLVRLVEGVRPKVTVLDGAGRAVSGVRVYVGAEDTASARRADEHLTDEAGACRLETLDPGRPYELYVEPPTDRHDVRGYQDMTWHPADSVVRLESGAALRGRVVDGDGTAVPGMRVHVRWGSDGDRDYTTSEPDGTFVIGSLPMGLVFVSAVEGGWSVTDAPRPKEAEVASNATDVVLVVPRRATVRIVVPGFERSRDGDLAVYLSARGRTHSELLKASGTATFDGISAEDTYALYVGPAQDGKMAYRKEVRASAAEVPVVLSEGSVIRGRLLLPPGATDADVRVRDVPVYVQGRLEADGRFEIRGLPPGTWTVHARATVGEDEVTGEAAVPAGGSADIPVR